MTDTSNWACSANDAVQLRLIPRNPGSQQLSSFQPAFTYPIFGEEELIFGYQSLKISLDFAADTLEAKSRATWSEKYEQKGETKAEDIEEKLRPFLPTIAQDILSQDGPFTPPGELVYQYETCGKEYGIWSTSLADPAAKALLRRMQIFVLFFIEGGSCIELDDPDWTIERWRVFFIYEIGKAPNSSDPSYSFVGYSTTYRLFFLDTSDPSNSVDPGASPLPDFDIPFDEALPMHLPSRVRISQFLILPPHQFKGHGTRLYTTMVTTFTADPSIREITVEDPNESFDDLRDYSDLVLLRTIPAFSALRINTDVTLNPTKPSGPDSSTPQSKKKAALPTSQLLDPVPLDRIRKSSKLATRQFARCVEMHLLSVIPLHHRSLSRITRKDRATDPNDRAYYFWRLLVKQRLYRHNLDGLAQLELEERREKLHETLAGVEADYVRILKGVDRRSGGVDAEASGGDSGVNGVGGGSANGSARKAELKRKILDDDDEDEGIGALTAGQGSSSKKARVEDESE